jgi:pimeloyl-ACP methyl ester carboxylesterase
MTNDPSIHLTRWGNSGPIVVMIHGSVQGSLISGGRHFSEQEKLAARGWQIVVPDRPGHGRSPSPGRPDDGVLDGHWVAELMGEGAHLVGHSFGGLVALCAAAERPEAVRSLTLIEPAIHQLAAADPVVAVFFKQQVEIFTSGKSPAEILADFSKVAGIPSSLRSGRTDPQEATRVGESLLKVHFPPDAVLRELPVKIAKAKLPVLIVTGGWNPAFDRSASIIAPQMGGTHQIVSSPDHFPQLASEEFNDVLDRFMRDADAAQGRDPRH